MDQVSFACGDNKNTQFEYNNTYNDMENIVKEGNCLEHDEDKINDTSTEMSLKERVTQCKIILEHLKKELEEEKNKFKTETTVMVLGDHVEDDCSIEQLLLDDTTSNNATCTPSYDENLLDYEKHLKTYQGALHLAEVEKQNAVKREMFTKSILLKLQEVEKQCNDQFFKIKHSIRSFLLPYNAMVTMMTKGVYKNEENTFNSNLLQYLERNPNASNSEIDLYSSNMATISADREECQQPEQ